jgi:predicted RNase H-like nuclease (RuvC/YqgF family)
MITNHEHRCKELEKEIKQLTESYVELSCICSDKIKQIEQLKKEVEGMRNCYNCKHQHWFEGYCTLDEQDELNCKNNNPYNWQPKTNKG